jgi:nitrile hydratase accessory protein
VIDREIANFDAAPLPRKNGELVFEAPWEGRAFGMAVALQQDGRYSWDAFRDRLVAAIAAAEGPPGELEVAVGSQARPSEGSGYYASWLAALEAIVLERGLVTRDELTARAAAFRRGERDEVF